MQDMKDTDYGAPPEPKGNYRAMTDAEILDSKKFRLRIGERFRDQLGDFEAAVMSCYIHRTDDADLGRYVREELGPHVKNVIDQIRYESEPVERIDPEAP
jgi:aromatic ring-cleaving dioxygenase